MQYRAIASVHKRKLGYVMSETAWTDYFDGRTLIYERVPKDDPRAKQSARFFEPYTPEEKNESQTINFGRAKKGPHVK